MVNKKVTVSRQMPQVVALLLVWSQQQRVYYSISMGNLLAAKKVTVDT